MSGPMGAPFGGLAVGLILVTSPVWLTVYAIGYMGKKIFDGVSFLATGTSNLIRNNFFKPDPVPNRIEDRQVNENRNDESRLSLSAAV